MVQRLWNLMKCHQVESHFGSADSKTQISEILAMPYFVLNSEGLLSAHRTSDSNLRQIFVKSPVPKTPLFLNFNKKHNTFRVSRPKCVRVFLPSLYLSTNTLWAVLKKAWCSSSARQNSVVGSKHCFFNIQNSSHSRITWPRRESRQPKSPDQEAYSRLSQLCAQHLDRLIVSTFMYCIYKVLACSITSLSLWSQVMRTKTSSLRQAGIKPRWLAPFIQSESFQSS